MYRKITVLCFALLAACALYAQEPLLVLEAEDARLTPPVKVKYVDGYSGNAYVGDNDSGSEIVFENIYVEKAGTYEFRTYYTSMFIRSIAVQSGFYTPVILTMTETTEDWNRPPVGMMLSYIYLDEGYNTLRITPYNGGGPNIDKFELWETGVNMPKPEKESAAMEIPSRAMQKVPILRAPYFPISFPISGTISRVATLETVRYMDSADRPMPKSSQTGTTNRLPRGSRLYRA